ncbi:hypothetical protein Efla_006079 [Eimeria flavescens]
MLSALHCRPKPVAHVLSHCLHRIGSSMKERHDSILLKLVAAVFYRRANKQKALIVDCRSEDLGTQVRADLILRGNNLETLAIVDIAIGCKDFHKNTFHGERAPRQLSAEQKGTEPRDKYLQSKKEQVNSRKALRLLMPAFDLEYLKFRLPRPGPLSPKKEVGVLKSDGEVNVGRASAEPPDRCAQLTEASRPLWPVDGGPCSHQASVPPVSHECGFANTLQDGIKVQHHPEKPLDSQGQVLGEQPPQEA